MARHRSTPVLLAALGAAITAVPSAAAPGPAARAPNLVLILADDLGWGEIGVHGQRAIQTPRIDRLAAEGMRFTDFYAGSTVCAPSRAVLMTGRHSGRASVRGNSTPDRQTLRAGERTIAHLFRQAGHATALFGKWGLGEAGFPGHPRRMGFDEFFGYLNQRHAHNQYPTFLWHGEKRVPLPNLAEVEDPTGAGFARVRQEYAHDRIVDEALHWLDRHSRRPFFLFLAVTLPHANNEAARALGNGQQVPDHGPYARRPWSEPHKGQAAMVSRLDRDVGRVLDRLAALGIDRNTLVIFSSDNGPHQEGGNDVAFFDASGPFRGHKRSLYEGGIRVPFLVRWPGRIPGGSVSSHLGYLGDLFATFAELVGVAAPEGLDSVSLLPTLLGRASEQEAHRALYWEFYEQGGRRAVRFGRWKAVQQPGFDGAVELYDLLADPGESHDLAASRPDEVREALRLMTEAHRDDPAWPVPLAAPTVREP